MNSPPQALEGCDGQFYVRTWLDHSAQRVGQTPRSLLLRVFPPGPSRVGLVAQRERLSLHFAHCQKYCNDLPKVTSNPIHSCCSCIIIKSYLFYSQKQCTWYKKLYGHRGNQVFLSRFLFLCSFPHHPLKIYIYSLQFLKRNPKI